MGKLITLDVPTRLDIPADRVLNAAIGKLDSVVIAGYDKEGQYYFASSYADGANVVWIIELLKKRLFEIAFDEE